MSKIGRVLLYLIPIYSNLNAKPGEVLNIILTTEREKKSLTKIKEQNPSEIKKEFHGVKEKR